MENVNTNINEQRRTRSPSPSIANEIQRESEERFNRLQTEMSTLKAMMEKLLEQNGEKVRQVDAVPTTSSFGVKASNSRINCNVPILHTLSSVYHTYMFWYERSFGSCSRVSFSVFFLGKCSIFLIAYKMIFLSQRMCIIPF